MAFKSLGNTGAVLLSTFLYQNDTIQTLDISHNNISDDGAIAIIEYLKANKTLKVLDISSNNITSRGIINIAEAIKINTSLILINVSKNKLTKSTNIATALSDCLKHNSTIQVLGMSWNDTNNMYVYTVGINDLGCIGNTWPQYHWTNNTVKYVSDYGSDEFDDCFISGAHKLNKLQFSKAEAILFTALLYGNVNVKTIKILWSNVTDDAAMVISEFLKTDQTLQRLKISQTALSSIAIKQIMESIKTNTSLQILEMSLNKITDVGAVAIIECLKNK